MKIYPADISGHLIEANVIEAFETCSQNFAHTMIWNQEGLLPAHENILSLCAVFVVKIGFLGLFWKRSPCGEASPMCHVGLIGCAPCRMPRLECVLGSNDLAFEIGGQRGVIRGKPYTRVPVSGILKLYVKKSKVKPYLQCADNHIAQTRPCQRSLSRLPHCSFVDQIAGYPWIYSRLLGMRTYD